MKKLVAFMVLAVLTGGVSPSAAGKTTFNNRDPEALCNYILQALHSCDVEAIAKTFNQANRNKLLPLNEKNRERILSLCREEKSNISGVQEVSELRKGPSFMGEGAVVGKIKVIGSEVIVIVLTKEGDTYGFEDINSPGVESYNSLPLLKK